MKSTVCFFDDYFVMSRPGTVRRIFRPERLGVLADDRSGLQLYTSMFYDPTVKKLRLYVEVPHTSEDTEVRDLVLFEGDKIEDFIGDGSKLKRTVVKGFDNFVHGASVFYDERATDPNKRYVFAGDVNANDRSKQRLAIAFSPDGISFSQITPIYPSGSDTYNSLYFDQGQEEYVLTMRSAWGDRRISVMRSTDLINWSKPQMILHPTACNGEGLEYYAFGVSRVDGVYYGLNWKFLTDIASGDLSNMCGYMENEIYYSYDGNAWTKINGLDPVVDRPLPPEYGSKQLWLSNVVDDGLGRTILVGGAARIAHASAYEKDDKFVKTAFYSVRKNGLVGLEGFGKDSKVTTKNFVFNGGDLTINCNAVLGSVSVAVLTPSGQVIEGFSHEDCIAKRGEDVIDGKVEWKNAKLDLLTGKRVRFEVVLNNAYLFSLSYDGGPSPNGSTVQNGYFNPLPKQR